MRCGGRALCVGVVLQFGHLLQVFGIQEHPDGQLRPNGPNSRPNGPNSRSRTQPTTRQERKQKREEREERRGERGEGREEGGEGREEERGWERRERGESCAPGVQSFASSPELVVQFAFMPVPHMVHRLSSAPSGRCTVWERTVCGPASHARGLATWRGGALWR